MTLRDWLLLIIRLLMSGVLLLAAVGKSASPAEFFSFLAQLRIQDQSLSSFTFIGLIFVEFFLGLCCLLGLAPRLTFRIIGTLFGVFAVVLLGAVIYHLPGSCGCFGNIISSEVGFIAIGRNLLFTTLAFYASRQQMHRFALSNVIERYFKEEEAASFPARITPH